MRLHDLKPRPGAKHRRKRLGQGEATGHGKTSGRGGKGQTARSGSSIRIGFEGGQMPLIRRIPKRGFTNIFRKEFAIVNLEQLTRFPEGTEVTPELLLAEGVISKLLDGLKVLGNGNVDKMLVVKAHKFSKKALAGIQSVGGRCEVIGQ
jgi:large subunit ribosomal protein L15